MAFSRHLCIFTLVMFVLRRRHSFGSVPPVHILPSGDIRNYIPRGAGPKFSPLREILWEVKVLLNVHKLATVCRIDCKL